MVSGTAAIASSAPSAIENDDRPATHTWEDTGEHSWDSAVREDAEGNIILAGSDTTAEAIRRRRKRLEQIDHAQSHRRVVRDMIRYLYVVVDASRWMREKDPVFPPGTRLDVTLSLLHHFVEEYYDQNPLSHLGFILARNGEAELLTQLSSSSKAHKVALQSVSQMAASEGPNKGGEFSLQNALEVAGRSLGHQPRHGSREILVVCAALSTCDPGKILAETLPRLEGAGIRVSTLALSAELFICRKIAEETGGVMGVSLDKTHFRDWLIGQCVPPPSIRRRGDDDDDDEQIGGCEMVHMGFPTRTSTEVPTLVHATRDTKLLAKTAHVCPQCQAKMAELPSDCAVCGLKLVLAPHLARSFHHLFPVPPFSEISMETSLMNKTRSNGDKIIVSSSSVTNAVVLDSKLVVTSADFDRCCFGCLKAIGTSAETPTSSQWKPKVLLEVGEEILRFQCPQCHNVFCADCDAYLHETLHNCPGCLSTK